MRILLAQRIALALVFLTFFGSMASAQESIRLKPGFSTLRTLDRPIGTIIIGNPEIADATWQGERQMVVTAKKILGQTNMIVLDTDNKKFFEADIFVGGQNIEKVQIHSRNTRGRSDLHEYYAYACPRRLEGEPERLCERVKDELETAPRFYPNEPGPLPQPQGGQTQPESQAPAGPSQ